MKNKISSFITGLIIVSFIVLFQNCYASDDNNPEANEFNAIYNTFKSSPRNGLVQLVNCADKNNKYCAFLLGYLLYHKKEYSKAYPYFIKSEGVFKSINSNEMFKGLNGKEVDTSDVFLGNMFSEGLGVEKNMDKAIDYYNRCMTMGDDACAYDISTLFVNDPVKTYAYTLVALKLQMATGTYDEHAKVDIALEVKNMRQNLDEQKIREGDKMANDICLTIPICRTKQIQEPLTQSLVE